MTLLSGFLDVLFRAWGFVGAALAVGGVVFRWIVLRRGEDDHAVSVRRAASLVALGAFLLAACQSLGLMLGPWSLADDNGHWPWEAYLATDVARAGIVRAAAAAILVAVALLARSRPRSSIPWLIATVLAVITMASGAPLTHGASRLTHAALLMTITVVHQLPALVWVGGALHLVGQWRLHCDSAGRDTAWPPMVARFSPLALGCIVLLTAAGSYLAWEYVVGPAGLIGTAYGVMLLTKLILMAAALLLAVSNRQAVKDWRASRFTDAIVSRAPVLIEAEAALGICILLAAAAFTGQPPAVDVRPEWAAPREAVTVFAPKWPQFRTPPWREMVAESTLALDPYTPARPLEKLQSDFNHDVSGAFVLLAGLCALLWRVGGVRWARHWPLVFVPLGVFTIGIAEPTVWPLGAEPFWATLASPEVLVHRLAAVMAIGLALFEWRVSAGNRPKPRAQYVFPTICVVGGALLLTHSHSVLATKWAFLIEISHNAIGIFAVFTGVARLLELRLPPRDRFVRIAGAIWPVCLALVGVVLLF